MCLLLNSSITCLHYPNSKKLGDRKREPVGELTLKAALAAYEVILI